MPFTTTRRVEFGDTDMAGIMHFSNFFRFMEAAETEYLRARGLSVAWEENGRRYGFPRVAASCDYSKPAKFGDVLNIAVIVEKVGTKSVSYRYEFTRGVDAIAAGRMTAVYCRAGENHTMESMEIPDELRLRIST